MTTFEIPVPLRLTPGSRALDRQAELLPDGRTLDFGMHGDVAAHYGVTTVANPLPSTLDYLVASVGGCLIGTFAGSLKRAKVPGVSPETLSGTARGEVSSGEDNVLVLRRITMDYRLAIAPEHADTAREVLAGYAARCPNARSVAGAIEIVSNLELTD
jgi:uncharacterized OsmC-like protein